MCISRGGRPRQLRMWKLNRGKKLDEDSQLGVP